MNRILMSLWIIIPLIYLSNGADDLFNGTGQSRALHVDPDHKPLHEHVEIPIRNEMHIDVIGAGPSGLIAAYKSSQKSDAEHNVKVTVYDKRPQEIRKYIVFLFPPTLNYLGEEFKQTLMKYGGKTNSKGAATVRIDQLVNLLTELCIKNNVVINRGSEWEINQQNVQQKIPGFDRRHLIIAADGAKSTFGRDIISATQIRADPKISYMVGILFQTSEDFLPTDMLMNIGDGCDFVALSTKDTDINGYVAALVTKKEYDRIQGTFNNMVDGSEKLSQLQQISQKHKMPPNLALTAMQPKMWKFELTLDSNNKYVSDPDGVYKVFIVGDAAYDSHVYTGSGVTNAVLAIQSITDISLNDLQNAMDSERKHEWRELIEMQTEKMNQRRNEMNDKIARKPGTYGEKDPGGVYARCTDYFRGQRRMLLR